MSSISDNKITMMKPIFLKTFLFSIVFIIYSGCSQNNPISKENIYNTSEKAIIYLKNLQQSNGEITIDNYKIFNVWETILAIKSINLWSVDKKDITIKSALGFLLDAESVNGMVYHNNTHKGSFCVETSAEYINMLTKHSFKRAKNKADFISKQQMKTGEWKIISAVIPENLQTFPSVTGFALIALYETGLKPLYLDSALNFLKKTQKNDGSWGYAWQYYGTPFYTMCPILSAIKKYDKNGTYNEVLKKARKFLFNCQQKDGSFIYDVKEFQNKPSIELQTILALRSLINCNVKFTDKRIIKGLKFLLRKQRADGSWDGGYFPLPNPKKRKAEDVFCTSEILMFLHDYAKLNKWKY